jgi:hypothetical protein
MQPGLTLTKAVAMPVAVDASSTYEARVNRITTRRWDCQANFVSRRGLASVGYAKYPSRLNIGGVVDATVDDVQRKWTGSSLQLTTGCYGYARRFEIRSQQHLVQASEPFLLESRPCAIPRARI